MSKNQLPSQPSLEHLKHQARDLVKAHKTGQLQAIARIRESHPHFSRVTESEIQAAKFRLNDAHLVLAREYGFSSWSELKKEVVRQEDKILAPAIEQFCKVIRDGDASAFRALINQYPALRKKLNAPLFDFGSPAIRMAVNQKNRALIDALLENGADINKRSEWEAGSFGVLDDVDAQLAEYLISQGAVVNIHAAAGLGKTDQLQELLKKDPSLVDTRGGDGGTPLHFARNIEIIDLLLNHNANLHIRDIDHNSTAAMWQIKSRENLYRLLAAGSTPDIFMACVHGDESLARRVLAVHPNCLSSVTGKVGFTQKEGGDIYNWKITHRARPISVAHQFGHHSLVEFLMSKATLKEHFFALCFMEKSREMRNFLAEHPDIISRLSAVDLEAFPDAIFFQKKKAVKTMIDEGFPITARGMDNGTPLHIAAWLGDLETVKLLIPKGVDLEDAKDTHAGTPLGWCCHGSRYSWNKNKGDYPGVARALLEAGANADIPPNKYGGNALDWATPQIIEVFKEF